VRLLPDELPESAVGDAPRRGGIPIGIDEGELEPVSLDFSAEPHFVVMGGNECGKSNLLDLIVRRVAADLSPEEARIVVLDYRRSLLDSVPGSHLLGYAASSTQAEKLMADVGAALRKRLPGPDVPPEELRSRSWWTGPDLYVVVDDYELIATSTGNPLATIADLIPQAADVGLHIVLGRGFGGAGRAMYDPVIQRIRDMGNPGLIMSGSRDEGILWSGVRGEPMPVGRGRFISRRHGARLVQTSMRDRATIG
jgi:S-DNA-T family DNA segregation ATPase FtsK/SpoIIIE